MIKNKIYMSEMRLPPRIPAGQGMIPMRYVPPPSFGNSGVGTPQPHTPFTQWFLTFYFVCQNNRGFSAVQVMSMIGPTYKTD